MQVFQHHFPLQSKKHAALLRAAHLRNSYLIRKMQYPLQSCEDAYHMAWTLKVLPECQSQLLHFSALRSLSSL